MIFFLLKSEFSQRGNSKLREVMKQLKEVWEREEKYWFQRSRIKWMKFSDKNTKFFHQITRQRRQINKVVRLKDGRGEWLEEEDIYGEFNEYYKRLFRTEGEIGWGNILDYVPKLVSEEMNKRLMEEIREEEIEKAIFQLGTYKAPGPDGFNGFFYQKYWEIVRKDVIEAVKGFFRSGRMLRELNAIEIVLIPKVKGPKVVGQFRPISLCNFGYKIISNVMVNRLQYWMGELITENQNAFVANRQIQDNILVA